MGGEGTSSGRINSKPVGCTLDEFLPLHRSEQKLVDCCRTGEWAKIGSATPKRRAPTKIVRATFIRFLALGGDGAAPVHAKGVQLVGAFVEGGLDLEGCTVEVPLWLANCYFEKPITVRDARMSGFYLPTSTIPGLYGDRMRCEGGVFLRLGFETTGPVMLQGAEISGAVDFTQASFKAGSYFMATGMVAKSRFIWKKVASEHIKVGLAAADIAVFADDMASWDNVVELTLDGCFYHRIAGGPTNASSRIKWLKKQPVEIGNTKFWPQPWEHLANVLRGMGHTDEAKEILIEKQREMYRLRVIGPEHTLAVNAGLIPFATSLRGKIGSATARALHKFYGALAGYGFRPLRTVVWMVAGWALATAIYSWGDERGLFAPRAAGLLADDNLAECRDSRWTRCPALPSGYNTFDPAMYSLDAILPLVDLKQEADWAPVLRRGKGWHAWDGRLLRATMWAEILFGWITSLLLASAVGRLVQKD